MNNNRYLVELSGFELVLLYLAYGNEDAKRIILRSIEDEKRFNEKRGAIK